MKMEVSEMIETYKDLVFTPSPNFALLQDSSDKSIIKVYSSWTIQDLVKAESTKFSQEFLLQKNSQNVSLLAKSFPCDVSSVSGWAFTKSGTRFAVFRKSKKTDQAPFLEIWNASQKERTFDMSDHKKHGDIYDGGNLQSIQWSANEKYILYIAEVKQKKSESYFKDLFCEKTDLQKPAEEATTKGEEYVYRETWGETYTTAHHSVLCILEVETGRVEVLNLNDKYENASVAQATWGPSDSSIVFVGYKEEPSRLGLVYCLNRRTSIYSYDMESKDVECLMPDENICAEYPVFSPNFETFVFLQNKAGGPHVSCRKLMKFDWKNKEISTVIDVVDKANDDDFAGIYISKLSSRWWSRDSRFFFFHTYRRSFLEVFCVDVLSSKVRKIDIDKSFGSVVLHHVRDPYILVSVSSPNIKPHLMIGCFTISEDGIKVAWNSVDVNSNVTLQDLNWDIHLLKPSLPNTLFSDTDYDIITVTSKEKNNGTLIIFPHGGPHSVLLADFYVTVAAYARLGYIVCLVNYRGSIGFGENSIKSLLGNIGSQDVSDVITAIEYLTQKESLGIKHVVGLGGSHGGFLIAHLLGQFPDLLKAAVIRNPVIDLTNMAEISDILDWSWIESGCSKVYNPLDTTNPSLLEEMWNRSPIRYIKNVKSPTLLCLGKNDLRVPPSQGLLFHRYLRAQNVPTKVFSYDDNHALSKIDVSSDVFMQTALWLQTHLSF